VVDTGEDVLPQRMGSYRVIHVIGAGGMGSVVRARHSDDGWAERQGGDVAIKLIHPKLAKKKSFRERFYSEAEIGRSLQHSSIANVYDLVKEGEWLGLVMEFIDGRPLTKWITPGGIGLEQSLQLLRPLASALDRLHEAGIVHRDLKPDNISVRPDGTPVILDLGIAKDLTSAKPGQTRAMTTMGTIEWMAPEQADAKNVGPAADGYAFGLITYALLCGGLPWAPETSATRIGAIKLMGNLIPLSDISTLGPDLSAVVMRMLATDPNERYASTSAFVDALEDPKGSKRPTGAAAAPSTRTKDAPEAVKGPAVTAEPPPSSTGGQADAKPQPAPTASASSPGTKEPASNTGGKLAIFGALGVLGVGGIGFGVLAIAALIGVLLYTSQGSDEPQGSGQAAVGDAIQAEPSAATPPVQTAKNKGEAPLKKVKKATKAIVTKVGPKAKPSPELAKPPKDAKVTFSTKGRAKLTCGSVVKQISGEETFKIPGAELPVTCKVEAGVSRKNVRVNGSGAFSCDAVGKGVSCDKSTIP
jgi:serine/threonine protein kinase